MLYIDSITLQHFLGTLRACDAKLLIIVDRSHGIGGRWRSLEYVHETFVVSLWRDGLKD